MYSRRELMGAAAIGAAAVLNPFRSRAALAAVAGLSPEDESFWFQVQQAFTVDRSIVNLNNGGVSPSPGVVQGAMKRHLDYSNSCPPPQSLWRGVEPQKEAVRERVAGEWGVDGEEVAFTRNSSEALQICQLGFDLKAGDEVLTTTQDYPRMLNTFRQRERREGIVLRQFRIPTPCEDPGE